MERFFKTIRSGFLSGDIANNIMELNEQLSVWLFERYHQKVHSSTNEKPIERYSKNIELIRKAPENLADHFRTVVIRTVSKDRVVHLSGKLYEAPIDLIGEKIEVLYHPYQSSQIEARFQGKSYGYMRLVDLGVNARVKRGKMNDTMILESTDNKNIPETGQLFSDSTDDSDIDFKLF